MDIKSLRKHVVNVLADMVEDSPTIEISDDMGVLSNLGLKSVQGADFAVDIEDFLGFEIPLAQNPFVDDDKDRERTVGEVTQWLFELACKKTKGVANGGQH